jgi:hypothetical protein
MINRREFVIGAASGALLAGMLPVAGIAHGAVSGVGRLSDGMSKGKFLALLNQSFIAYANARGGAHLRLVEVRELRARSRLDQFSLFFRGDAAERLESGIYLMEHPRAGQFEVRVDVVGGDERVAVYRSDFSLLV